MYGLGFRIRVPLRSCRGCKTVVHGYAVSFRVIQGYNRGGCKKGCRGCKVVLEVNVGVQVGLGFGVEGLGLVLTLYLKKEGIG